MNILVTGASGFVGRGVVAELTKRGHTVLAASREGQDVGAARGLKMDVGDLGSVQRGMGSVADLGAVVHLVGIIAEKGAQTFARVHVEATRNMLSSTPRRARYLHMSALGADPASQSGYSRSKGEAESLVRASGLDFTIFRPSLIFGPGDDFFGRVLKQLVSLPPVVPQIGDGRFPFRPVSLSDVATAFAQALAVPSSVGQTYALTGPQEYTFRELLELELKALGKRKPILPVPLALMNLAVPLMNLLPSPPITRDQYVMLKAGNTAPPEPARTMFALPMLHLEDLLPQIVGKKG
ncbi:complex I NDUFA9 subunit family protein [Deinococcus sp. KNUC1210]|uniref:complex I NDUFA9 subunit family protein n=1 Tax=Deinococcus sp. KNUC1210 TaxID=2917691 RepID=UPI001EEFACCF|nr:complex I NDUFA9 subunit family protein [Deinococcus sp. KNUC1210]ULH16345.1 complex I NDUFA9 subunit family protein [Deinococcus sp. KNUC1210]